ncbi:YnfA family protein [Methylopila sp. M107]|uniref:YnfA family protein n=1 Tax=Methylopila sp. M107 TaxID=1101190 RepID=UPI00035D8DD6|nr:YnfA family protein [Methylopila sp. M107]
MTAAIYIAAAIAEIAGCFAFWTVLRQGAPAIWLIGGLACLVLFAWLLTLVEVEAAGRAYAAYGGVYVAASLGWLWAVEGVRPDRWDVAGSAICVIGASVVLFGPRG